MDSLEKEIFKLRSDLKRSETTIQKLQDNAALNSQNHNNTSSAFSLPSEFKKVWEVMVLENILDTFSSFLSDHVIFAKLVQDLIKIIMAKVKAQIDLKVQEVMQLMSIPKSEEDGVRKYLLKLFQDYSLKAFPGLSVDNIKDEYADLIGDIDNIEDFEDMISSPEFSDFIRTMHKLSLHMCLNEPQLAINFPENLEYLVFDKPDEFYCIDGFPKNAPPCVVIVPPVMRNNHAYQGIKPAILVLTTKDVEEANKKTLIKKIEPKPAKRSFDKPSELNPPKKIPLIDIKEKVIGFEDEVLSKDVSSFKTSTVLKDLSDTKETQIDIDQFSFSKERIKRKISDEENDPPMSKSPIFNSKSMARDTSPRQVMDLYCRYKTQNKERKTSSLDEERSLCYLPLQRKSPIRVSNFIRSESRDTSRHYQSARVFEKPMQMGKKNEICMLCKPKLPCTRCAKTSLLALSNRIPLSVYNQRAITPVRAFSSSTLNSSGKLEKGKTISMHSRKQSPNCADKPQGSDKCKVM